MPRRNGGLVLPNLLIFFFSPEELAVLDVYIGNLLILKSQHFFKNTTPFRPDKICA